MKRKPILIDLDETVYPFLHTWNRWLEQKGQTVDEAFYWFYDLDLYLVDMLQKQPDFIEATRELRPEPLPEAMQALTRIAEHYPITAVTARNANEWQDITEDWVGEHLPFVTDIYFTRDGKQPEPTPKGIIAEKLNAYALIDDTAAWIQTLPENVRGYIVERPHGYASDYGAVSWERITLDILRKAA